MATVIKCDICGAEGAKHVRTIVNKKYSLDGKFYKELFYKELELDLCKNCISKASNIITDECEKVFTIKSNTEKLRLNEGYINIYEDDGKEEPYISYIAYKTMEEAIKEKEAHCGNGYYLKTIKISW